MGNAQTKIAFVDDHPAMLQGLKGLFSSNPAYEIVGEGTSADDARTIAETAHPDVLFMDLSMPGNVCAAIHDISHTPGNTKVMVCTAFASPDAAMKVLDAGASGIVLKTSRREEFITATESVTRGHLYVTGEFAVHLLERLRAVPKPQTSVETAKLNFREQQIMNLLHKARTNREIASTLYISEKTVKRYMTTLMQKLHARNRLEAVVKHSKLQSG
jgi:two-component system, NarL family, nitrate/nitrite response regulator NarL